MVFLHHPSGVYQGEEPKHSDYSVSLPPFLTNEVLLPALEEGGGAVVLAEEWQTADAVLEFEFVAQRDAMGLAILTPLEFRALEEILAAEMAMSTVDAEAMRSCPSIAMGMALAWMGVGSE